MKKQIALLATLIAASGFTACAQDWLQFTLGGVTAGIFWDETTTPGSGIETPSAEYDVTFLWTQTGAADDLSAIGGGTGGTNYFGQAKATPLDQVATNGVPSTGVGIAEIETMLQNGWNIAENAGSGNALAITTTAASGKLTPYNSGTAFELNGGTLASGGSIEMIEIAWNASATLGSGADTFDNVADLGWSNPFAQLVGSGSSDPNDNATQSSHMNAFGVAPVPEPTTLALAGLGGLSMLFLRRRKA